MGTSRKKIQLFKSLSKEEAEKLKRMAWDDGTSYSDIYDLFKLTPNQVEDFMRFYLDLKDYKRWRLRLSKRSHQKGRSKHWAYSRPL